jgi:hypothetical protein
MEYNLTLEFIHDDQSGIRFRIINNGKHPGTYLEYFDEIGVYKRKKLNEKELEHITKMFEGAMDIASNY